MAEIYAGIRSGEETQTSLFLSSLECHALDRETGKQAGLLKSAWAKRGKTISLPDAIVAAIAIQRGCTLVTMQPMLVKRRSIDLCRIAGCLCRAS